jgi:hypothetical protein
MAPGVIGVGTDVDESDLAVEVESRRHRRHGIAVEISIAGGARLVDQPGE